MYTCCQPTLARSLSQSPIESHAIIKVALGRLRLGPPYASPFEIHACACRVRRGDAKPRRPLPI